MNAEDKANKKNDRFKGMFDEDALYRDDCGEEEQLSTDNKANHRTQYYRVAVRGMLGEFDGSPSYQDYERMVYYCLPEEIRRSVAVGQVEIEGDQNIRHLLVRYYFPSFLKLCPALSKCSLRTDISYDGDAKEVVFSAELFREMNHIEVFLTFSAQCCGVRTWNTGLNWENRSDFSFLDLRYSHHQKGSKPFKNI